MKPSKWLVIYGFKLYIIDEGLRVNSDSSGKCVADSISLERTTVSFRDSILPASNVPKNKYCRMSFDMSFALFDIVLVNRLGYCCAPFLAMLID